MVSLAGQTTLRKKTTKYSAEKKRSGLQDYIMVVITIIKEKLYVQPTIVLLLSLAQ